MSENAEKQEADKVLFNSLVMMFAQSAMQQMGVEMEEGGGKGDVDLEGAQMTIDLLQMLQAKTQGNLDKQDSEMLSSTLSELQMTYVLASKGKR